MDEYDDLLARVRSGSTVPAAPALPAAPKMDEYDSLLKQVRTPDLVPAQTATYNGSFSNPAQAAERLNLARDIKKMLGEDVAPSIIDPVEDARRVRQAQMDHGIRQSASLRKWIEDDPTNAGLIDGAGAKNLADTALHIGRVGAGLLFQGGVTDLFQSAYATAAMPFKLIDQGMAALGLIPEGSETYASKWLMEGARSQKGFGEWAVGSTPEGNWEAGTQAGIRSMGGNTAVAIGIGLLTRNPVKTAAGVMGLMAGSQSAMEAFDEGKSATTALASYTTDATAEVVMENYALKGLFAIPGLKQGAMSFLKGAGKFAVKEVGSEVATTIWQNFDKWMLVNPEKTWEDFKNEQPDAIAQTIIATIVGGGGQIAIQQAMVRGRQAETKALFDALHEGAQNSELLKNVPEKYREFVKQATADGGVETVFVPAEKFTTYFQSAGMDPVAIAEELGATNYTEAMAAGSDVMIPMDSFATLIAGSDHYAGLQNDLKLRQGDLTATEQAIADANEESNIEKLQADIERIAADNDTSLNAQIARIQDDIALQLSPRYDKQTADTFSQVMRVIAVATARDTQNKAQAEGRTASEAEIQQAISAQLAKYDIKINANPILPEILTKRPNFKAEIDPMLDMLRAGQGPSEQDIFGTSLVDFIRERGGLAPVGELQDVEKVKTPAFKSKLIQDLGKRLDEMAMAAVEAGYFPGTEDGQLTESQLVEAILNEIGGAQKTYAGFDESKLNMRETLEGLSKALDQYGLDPKTMDNEAIKAALFAEPTYEQGGATLEDVRQQWDAAGITGDMSEKNGLITLSRIVVPAGERGAGKGTDAMQALVDYADATGQRIALSPSADFGGNKKRLLEFYKRFGFTENKGRSKDFAVSETMIREPQKVGAGTTAFKAVDTESAEQKYWAWARQPVVSDLVDPAVDRENVAGMAPDGTEEYWKAMLTAGRDAVQMRAEERGITLPEETNPSILYQPENRAQIRIGADRKINIDLLKGANWSSFVHEVGHFYLEFLGDLAENGSQQTKDDYAAILKWMGVASRDQIKVEHHEMFARANERYLMEGKAPSIELRSAFARFKGWLTSIYKTLTSLDVKLTDEVREVFDRIYATDAEIVAARAENDLIDIFTTAEQMGVSQAEFEAYRKQAGKEIQSGDDKLREKVMRVQRLKREQWWRDELAKTRTEVATEIDGLKSYQAHDALTAKDSELKIDRVALVEQYGEPILKRLPRGFGDGRGAIYTGKGQSGVAVGTAAQLLGYDSADALIEDMANLKPRNKMIAAEADARMNERYGDILNSIEIADEAQAALHNSERGSKLAMELKALRALQRKVDPILKARAKDQAADEKIGRQHSLDVAPVSVFREAARRVMATKLIRDIRPNDYLVAERKANQRAYEALGKKDYGAAQEAKQQELLNFALYQEAMRVKAEMKKLHDFVARFEKGPMREKLGKAGEQYLEAAQAILEDVELTNKSLKAIDRTKLRNWLREIENSDLYVTEDMVSGTFAKNWKDLTVEEMRAISDALKNIDHVAGRQLKIMVGQKMMDFKETVDGISASIREHGGKEKPVSMEEDGKFIRFIRGFNAQNRKISSLVRQMDGGVENGPFYNAFVRSMNERGAWESDKNSEATKALVELYAPILKMKGGITGDVRMITGLGVSLSRGARLSMALNWGNEGNRQRILGSDYGNGMMTPAQVNAVLDTLTREEWTFVNQTWKFINDFWPEIAAKEKRVYGVAPEKVEAAPFSRTLADGSTIALTGGYYPIKYDQSKDDKAAAHDQAALAQEVMRGAFTAQTTRKGHTESRVEEVKRPVRLSLDVITEHVAQVTHDLAWHEWLIDATRIMRSRKISSAIRDHYGDAVLKTMRDALTGIAVGDLANQTAADTALMYLRANVQRSTIGFSITTAFLQPFGLTQSMARIGPKYVLRGIADWTGDMVRFENTITKIREKSVFMKHRGETFNRELNEIKGRVTGNQSKARQIYDASLFMLMQKMQAVADVPTWLGAYDKAIESNSTEEEAISLADRAVLESQGGGQTKDMTEFQRKHPMLTVFFSYFSVTYNLMAESTAKTSFKNPMSVAGWVSDMMLLAVIPALGPAIILSLLRGDDDDDWMAKLAKWQAAYLMGTLPLVREAGGSIEGFGYAGPPAGRIVSDTAKLGSQVVKVWNDEADATDEQPVLAAVRFLGSFLGIPTVQAIRTYKGWKAWDDGEAPASAILVGPPRADK